MPTALRSLVVVMILVLGSGELRGAERERFKLGGGGGIGFPSDPDLDLPSAGTFGGFVGYRFNDNWSIEGGFYFARFNSLFLADGTPVDQNATFDENRISSRRSSYSAEGTLIINIGRRKQLHPFLLVGAGASRRENQSVVLSPGATTVPPIRRLADFVPTGHFGAGFDVYFLYNVSARAELRYTLPNFDNSLRSIRFIFGATYSF